MAFDYPDRGRTGVHVVTNFPAIIRVDGLDTIRRLAPRTIQVSTDMLEKQAMTSLSRVPSLLGGKCGASIQYDDRSG